MNSKERVLHREQERGKAAALNLAYRASNMNNTAIIAEEDYIPVWSEHAVYSPSHVGYPVQDDGQIYIILTAHTPAHNPGRRPADLRAIYSLLHTKDPAKAKSWVAPLGTSGLYMKDEVCTYPHSDGTLHIWCCLCDNTSYPPLAQSANLYWKDIAPADQFYSL